MAKREKAVRYKRKNTSGMYIFITVLLMSLAVILGIGIFFTVSEIEIEGNNAYTDEEVLVASGIEIGDNILFIRDSSTVIRLRENLEDIEEVVIDREFPDKINIRIAENIPASYIVSEGEKWLVDRNCRLEKMGDDVKLSELIKIQGVELVEPADGEIMTAAAGETQVKYLSDTLKALYKYEFLDEVTYLNVANIGSIEFDYKDRYVVDLGAQGDIDIKISMLEKVVNSSNIDPSSSGEIEFVSESEVHFIPN